MASHLYNFCDAECDLTIQVFLCSLARSLKCLFCMVSTYIIFYSIKCWIFNILRILHSMYTHINWDLNYHLKLLNLKSISFFTWCSQWDNYSRVFLHSFQIVSHTNQYGFSDVEEGLLCGSFHIFFAVIILHSLMSSHLGWLQAFLPSLHY